MTTPGVGPVARPPTEAAPLVLLRDPVNESAGYTSKNIKCRMVKSLRQTGQPSLGLHHTHPLVFLVVGVYVIVLASF
jgi:hypothetical protein